MDEQRSEIKCAGGRRRRCRQRRLLQRRRPLALFLLLPSLGCLLSQVPAAAAFVAVSASSENRRQKRVIYDGGRPDANDFFRRKRRTAATTAARWAGGRGSLSLPDSVFETIQQGRIAVIDNYIPAAQVKQLQQDARNLYADGYYITDSLAGYKPSQNRQDKSAFDPSKDRSVLPAYIPSKKASGPFVDDGIGDARLRKRLTQTAVARLRRELSVGLDRPALDTPDGPDNHEVSYTRFGPGAYLKRHSDEHHEELKGRAGWLQPTRRSLSWLIYLNDPDWDAGRDGGCLRTYPRVAPSAAPVGARSGDLQIGWLRPAPRDPVERPVFLDGRRRGVSGNCALYIDHPTTTFTTTTTALDNNPQQGQQRLYLTEDFRSDPYLFVSTGDWVVQHVLMGKYPEYGNRFHYIEPPKSLLTAYMDKLRGVRGRSPTFVNGRDGETVWDVPPTGGTLVVFDSVALPHEVLPTLGRERWAASGWFHEPQQPVPPP